MNLKDAAGTFSQLSGVLASFCVAFAILLLTPAVFPQGGGMPQDLVISLLLLSVTLYSIAAGILANATKYAYPHIRLPYKVGIICFLLSNVLVLSAIVIIIRAFGLPMANVIAIGMLVVAAAILLLNVLSLLTFYVRNRVFFHRLSPDKQELYLHFQEMDRTATPSETKTQ